MRTADTWNVTKEMNKWNDADFLTNQIRDQQDDHEDVHEQIVIPKTAQPCVARDQPANHDVDLNCSGRRVACIFAVAAGTAASTQERLFFAVEVICFFPFDHNAIGRRRLIHLPFAAVRKVS